MTGLPRSWLLTPGPRPDRFFKAANTAADALILYLEDASKRVTFAAFPWRWEKGDGCIVRLVAIVDPTGKFRIETGNSE